MCGAWRRLLAYLAKNTEADPFGSASHPIPQDRGGKRITNVTINRACVKEGKCHQKHMFT